MAKCLGRDIAKLDKCNRVSAGVCWAALAAMTRDRDWAFYVDKSSVSAAQSRQMDMAAIAGCLCSNPKGSKRLRYWLAELS